MKKAAQDSDKDEMRSEYDFRGAARGKYSSRYEEGSNLVLLEPDVAEAFPTSASVNEALRSLIKSR